MQIRLSSRTCTKDCLYSVWPAIRNQLFYYKGWLHSTGSTHSGPIGTWTTVSDIHILWDHTTFDCSNAWQKMTDGCLMWVGQNHQVLIFELQDLWFNVLATVTLPMMRHIREATYSKLPTRREWDLTVFIWCDTAYLVQPHVRVTVCQYWLDYFAKPKVACTMLATVGSVRYSKKCLI